MKKIKKFVVLAIMLIFTIGGFVSNPIKSSAKTGSSSFIYAINGDPESTNPLTTSDRWGLTFDNIQYSPLFHVESNGSLTPVLATRESIASNGLAVSVDLKKNVKWSDGKPFTADDVVFTYEKLANKATGNSDKLYINSKPITVKKINDYQVKFILPSKSASALNNIVTETFIIPKHIYAKTSDLTTDSLTPGNVGTGPYRLVSYKQGQYLKFVRNDNYFGKKPQIKNLELRILTDTNTTSLALKKGEVDAAFVLPAQLKTLKGSGLQVFPFSEDRIGYYGLNTHSKKLSNVKVRQAIFYALNKNQFNKAAYLNKKYYNTPYSFLPPKNAFATTDLQKYQTNDNKAKSLLKSAGVKNLSITLGYSTGDDAQKIQANLIQQQLAKIGVKVDIRATDPTALSTAISKRNQTKYDSFLGGYIMGTDPYQYTPLYLSNSSYNYWQYHNSTIDKYFNQGDATSSNKKRRQIYNKLQQKIANSAIIYPIVDNKKILVVNKNVKGVKAAHTIPIYTLEDWSQLKK